MLGLPSRVRQRVKIAPLPSPAAARLKLVRLKLDLPPQAKKKVLRQGETHQLKNPK